MVELFLERYIRMLQLSSSDIRSRKRHDYILLEREREAISAGEGVMGWTASNLIFRLTDKQGAWANYDRVNGRHYRVHEIS